MAQVYQSVNMEVDRLKDGILVCLFSSPHCVIGLSSSVDLASSLKAETDNTSSARLDQRPISELLRSSSVLGCSPDYEKKPVLGVKSSASARYAHLAFHVCHVSPATHGFRSHLFHISSRALPIRAFFSPHLPAPLFAEEKVVSLLEAS